MPGPLRGPAFSCQLSDGAGRRASRRFIVGSRYFDREPCGDCGNGAERLSNAPKSPGERKTMTKTLYDKIFDDHTVDRQEDGTCLLYIDRHLVHEVTSPQAFEGLRLAGRAVRAPEKTLAVVDHNVPTSDRSKGIHDPEAKLQVETLARIDGIGIANVVSVGELLV